jgi:hypothetical protein
VGETYTSPEPHISLSFQDMNGLNITDGFTVSLNGRELTGEEIVLPDSLENGNQLSVDIRPQLQPGMNILSMMAQDAYGNFLPAQEYRLQVAKEFQLSVLGNFPNPFDEETIIAYMLTLPCEDLSIKLYTASGRLIRDLDPYSNVEDPNPLSTDYHEVMWDGTDDDGNQVANGVYFYKIEAKSGNQTRKVMGKIARIQ